MTNSSYNLFVIILGFLLLGLPIILISIGTQPPTSEQFYSNIVLPDDVPSELENIYAASLEITGNSSYWASLGTLSQLTDINNISELIENEEAFLNEYNVADYGGFKRNRHIFNLTINLETIPTDVETVLQISKDLFGEELTSTFMFQKIFEEADPYSIYSGNYPNVTSTIESLYSTYDIGHYISVEFNANIEINEEQITTSFSRLLFIGTNNLLLFFLTNEIAWEII